MAKRLYRWIAGNRMRSQTVGAQEFLLRNHANRLAADANPKGSIAGDGTASFESHPNQVFADESFLVEDNIEFSCPAALTQDYLELRG